jgi:hypothetical protein
MPLTNLITPCGIEEPASISINIVYKKKREAMKRCADDDEVGDAKCPIPSLPPELWDRIVSEPCFMRDTPTISSVFLLNKQISTYLTTLKTSYEEIIGMEI